MASKSDKLSTSCTGGTFFSTPSLAAQNRSQASRLESTGGSRCCPGRMATSRLMEGERQILPSAPQRQRLVCVPSAPPQPCTCQQIPLRGWRGPSSFFFCPSTLRSQETETQILLQLSASLHSRGERVTETGKGIINPKGLSMATTQN